MKKLHIKMVTVFAAVVLLLGADGVLSVKAEEGKPHSVSTLIEVEINDDVLVFPETPGNGGDKPTDTENKLTGLAIVTKPVQMKFEGQFKAGEAYSIGLVSDKYKNNEKFYERMLVVGDVRSSKHGWTLSAKLELEELENENVDMTMKVFANKMKLDNEKFVYEKEVQGVKLGNPKDGHIAISNAQKTVATAESNAKSGKGYTGLFFDDIKLNFPENIGEAKNYKGEVVWTLSEGTASTDQ